ncbi:MAG: DUF1730 domain-containing protein [Caldilineaceae bacterium]
MLSDETELRSIIVLGVNYHQFALPENVRTDPSRGLIASYAWGDDYHDLIKPQLFALDAFIAGQTGRTARKCLVDTGPVLERDWAMQAGIGFTGKNCCTIRPGAELALLGHGHGARGAGLRPAAGVCRTDRQRRRGLRRVASRCRCRNVDAGRRRRITSRHLRPLTRCLTACPTDAFVGPFHLNPQRCISYWTIESQRPSPRRCARTWQPYLRLRHLPGSLPVEPAPAAHAPAARLDGAKRPRRAPLLEGFAPATPYWLEQAAFNARFRRSPVKRAKRHGMLRNVCVALGNWADPAAVPALVTALHDADPLPRGHAAWALGRVWARHADARARDALAAAQAAEADAWVRSEIADALHAGTAASAP